MGESPKKQAINCGPQLSQEARSGAAAVDDLAPTESFLGVKPPFHGKPDATDVTGPRRLGGSNRPFGLVRDDDPLRVHTVE